MFDEKKTNLRCTRLTSNQSLPSWSTDTIPQASLKDLSSYPCQNIRWKVSISEAWNDYTSKSIVFFKIPLSVYTNIYSVTQLKNETYVTLGNSDIRYGNRRINSILQVYIKLYDFQAYRLSRQMLNQDLQQLLYIQLKPIQYMYVENDCKYIKQNLINKVIICNKKKSATSKNNDDWFRYTSSKDWSNNGQASSLSNRIWVKASVHDGT